VAVADWLIHGVSWLSSMDFLLMAVAGTRRLAELAYGWRFSAS
jgi:hypothetical protein